ncbi:hypothetical protein [Sphingomonas bacterium]|uniref:hypothetical protein n=1 Tax=Sphingomonas bacterium TaxID=1895847 RepID=UPI001576A987|nr:hypothetical protein [Sphingomonas bacterium]
MLYSDRIVSGSILMRTTLLTISILSFVISASSAIADPLPIEWSVTARANPIHYVGKCPAVITFDAHVSVVGAPAIEYRFIRSDGATGPMQSIESPPPGMPTSTTWTLGGSTLKHYEGWEQLVVKEIRQKVPHGKASRTISGNRAAFSIDCTG